MVLGKIIYFLMIKISNFFLIFWVYYFVKGIGNFFFVLFVKVRENLGKSLNYLYGVYVLDRFWLIFIYVFIIWRSENVKVYYVFKFFM